MLYLVFFMLETLFLLTKINTEYPCAQAVINNRSPLQCASADTYMFLQFGLSKTTRTIALASSFLYGIEKQGKLWVGGAAGIVSRISEHIIFALCLEGVGGTREK